MTVARRGNVQIDRVSADHRAAALEQDDIPPAAERVLPDPPLGADALEPDPFVEREARAVLGEDAGEQGPQAGRLGGGDEGFEERAPDPAAARLGPDVHALPGDPEVRPPRRVGAQGRPAQDRPARLVAGDEAAVGAMRVVEVMPVGRLTLERASAVAMPSA